MAVDELDDEEFRSRFFVDLACAFVRGRLAELCDLGEVETLRRGMASGLRIHKFKRNTELPRVRRVLGTLRGLGPTSLLDVGSGRGTFLWPLLDAFPDLPVTAIDRDERRATDLRAVREGGIERLNAVQMDAEQMQFDDRSFDVVTLLEVLEHFAQPDRAASHAIRVASRCVVASVPSEADENPEHLRLYDPSSLESLLVRAGARRVAIDHVRGHIVAVASR